MRRALLIGLAVPRTISYRVQQHLQRSPSQRSGCRHFTCSAAGFEQLGVHPLILPVLDELGFKQPTEPQTISFGSIAAGHDVVLLAETGTGKTLAYAIPLIQQLLEQRERVQNEAGEAEGPAPVHSVVAPAARRRSRGPEQALVLLPNRELCSQARAVN